MAGDRVDFFVSHAGADRAWAEWVAWQLTDAGYTVELDVWDWAAGRNFVAAMSDALDRCDRMVALFSAAYFERERYTTPEWTAAVLHVPGTGEGRLVPVRVEDVPVEETPGVLRPLAFRDLFGVGEEQARRALLEAVAGPRRPDHKPMFPGRGTPGELSRLEGSGPQLPGSVPRVWNIPARNPGFTGRDGLLVAVRSRLLSGDNAVVQAFEGMGGVGKTQLAMEYAHRFASTYDLAWWINCEQAGLIGDQFAALGRELQCVEPHAGIEAVRSAVLGDLRQRGRWLLVFDNAETPSDVSGWLPGGGGHVLVTSRERHWAEIASPVEVDVLARSESAAILQARVAGLSDTDADRLAAQLGDLPLAIAQAAGFMAETGIAAGDYLGLLAGQTREILRQGRPAFYPASLAAATEVTVDRLARDDLAASELASVCAFLAPEPIPQVLLTGAASVLPGELAARATNPIAWRQTLAHLTRHSLARIDYRGLQMHRLTQAILRDRLRPGPAATARAHAEALLAAPDLGDAGNPSSWPEWAVFIPHLLAADLAATSNSDLCWQASRACWYLRARGDARACHELASHLYQHWRERLGGDDSRTLAVAHTLAAALRVLGRYADARDLDENSLARERRLRGDDHPNTLHSANSLAFELRKLGEVQAARDLDQDTLERRRRVLGDDHPDTLASASDLANDMRKLEEADDIPRRP